MEKVYEILLERVENIEDLDEVGKIIVGRERFVLNGKVQSIGFQY